MKGAVMRLFLETSEDNLILTRFLFHATVVFNLYKALKGVLGVRWAAQPSAHPNFFHANSL
jgi:hypothetical protein